MRKSFPPPGPKWRSTWTWVECPPAPVGLVMLAEIDGCGYIWSHPGTPKKQMDTDLLNRACEQAQRNQAALVTCRLQAPIFPIHVTPWGELWAFCKQVRHAAEVRIALELWALLTDHYGHSPPQMAEAVREMLEREVEGSLREVMS